MSTANTTIIAVEDIKDWAGQDVIDLQGDKLGKLQEVFYDAENDAPTFVAVKSGLFGNHLTLVTLTGAAAGRAYLRVAIDKKMFKNAPNYDPAAELTIEDESGAYDYYGLVYEPVGDGARRLAKR